MSQGAVIGALRGVLVLDASDWSPAISRARGDLSGLRGALQDVARVVESLGEKMRSAGVGLTAGISAPLAAVAVTSNKAASSFEAAMKTVESALGRVSGRELKALSDQARALGPAVGKSAVEAVEGMDALARAGLNTSQILGGGLKSTLDLAAAGMADVAPSAALVTDAMGQFKLTASQLPYVVGSVVGALDASKFGFVDFQQAVAQGGGAAASASMSFRDFSTAIAATSTQFSSGSDAGTSFKTYLSRLVPASNEAAAAMKALNINFFDADGRMKPLADQAELLKTAFAGLSDETKKSALTKIFGDDAFRTALGLMEQGRQGVERLQETIAKGDVEGKIAKRLEGEAAAANRLSNAWESVRISIGQAGLTELITSVKNAFAGMLESFAAAPPLILKIGVAFGAIAAAAGPLLLVLTQIGAFIIPLVAARFGLLGLALSALVNPLGTVAMLVARLITTFAQGAIIARTAALMAGLLSPMIVVTAALTALTYAWQANEARVAASRAEQDRLRNTMNGAKPALDKVALAVADMTGKTGEAAKAARDHANALLSEARAAVIAAQALARKRIAAAQAAVTDAKTKKAEVDERVSRGGFLSKGVNAGARIEAVNAEKAARLAVEEMNAAADGFQQAKSAWSDMNKAINAPAPTVRTVSLEEVKAPKTPKVAKTAVPGGTYAAENREQLQLQADLDTARARGDRAAEKALQDRMALSQQIEAYQRTGLSLDQARVAAQRDMSAIATARGEAVAREIAETQAAVAVEAARLGADQQVIEALERQEELKRRIASYYELTKNLAEATRLAEADQAKIDGARAAVRQRWFKDDARDRAVQLAQARGDSEERIRQLQREVELRQRARDLQGQGVPEADAMARATTEWDEENRARMVGNVRATFQEGMRAAMDGNIGDFMKNWWRDRVAKGMEEAINSLADLVSRLFSNIGKGASGGSSGGGILGALGSVFGLIAGAKGKSGGFTNVPAFNIAPPIVAPIDVTSSLPGFATGGSFRVGGMSGVDRNVIAFRATKGEMVDIRKPGADAGVQRLMVVPSPYFDVAAADAAAPSIQQMGVRAAAGGSAMARADMARSARRKIRR
ncbi:phage tail tape measure protein [Sphingomonas corticis]|uniref:Phage tail tape measure protein n=1 Tax=Sphingomonas corticis TaxID=2722791 RepID=A0ABX1CR90_9SPHN|nr:phage tail tape measure protein [Sphingomonas corticis]NJR80459.1 phage tail tape measure protein [Sphingomonas corticis]